MSQVKPALNSPHGATWLVPVGKLVLNFGAIEMHTYLWLGDLAEDKQLPYQAVEWPFKKRVEKVTDLIGIKIKDKELINNCLSSWKEVLEIAKFRNAIVHNPVVFGWSGPEQGSPDIIGIPDVGHLGKKAKVTKRVASIADINGKCDEIVALATRLFDLRELCQAHI